MAQAVSVTPSNKANIQVAIRDLAIAHSGIPLLISNAQTKLGDLFLPAELQALAEFPALSVRRAKFAGWAKGTVPQGGGDAGMRGIQMTEPMWDFDIWCIYPYSPANLASQNYPQVDTAQTLLMLLYTQYYDLSGTCELSTCHSFDQPYIALSGRQFIAAKLTIRAFEQLPVLYQ